MIKKKKKHSPRKFLKKIHTHSFAFYNIKSAMQNFQSGCSKLFPWCVLALFSLSSLIYRAVLLDDYSPHILDRHTSSSTSRQVNWTFLRNMILWYHLYLSYFSRFTAEKSNVGRVDLLRPLLMLFIHCYTW